MGCGPDSASPAVGMSLAFCSLLNPQCPSWSRGRGRPQATATRLVAEGLNTICQPLFLADGKFCPCLVFLVACISCIFLIDSGACRGWRAP